jgi:hypothetical protein
MRRIERARRVCCGILLLPLCAALVAGCRSHGPDRPEDGALVRLINAVPDVDELTVAVDGQRVWKHSLYRENTGYQVVPEGTYEVSVGARGPEDLVMAHRPLQFQRGSAYTIIALGSLRGDASGGGVRIFLDDRDPSPPGDKVRVRFINAAPGFGAVDVLFNNIVGLQQVPFANRSDPLLLDPGAYDLKVNESGGYVTPLIGPVSLHLEGGHSYTLVAMGQRHASTLALEAYPDNK